MSRFQVKSALGNTAAERRLAGMAISGGQSRQQIDVVWRKLQRGIQCIDCLPKNPVTALRFGKFDVVGGQTIEFLSKGGPAKFLGYKGRRFVGLTRRGRGSSGKRSWVGSIE